jgi:undecaprenyl phosphate N,N'-diacetylbacillosamine 1-phosphate transferase
MFFSPIYIIVSLIIWMKLGRPIIFRQERPGLNEKIFELYKLRTMRNDKDENGELLPNEQRLSSVGNYIRATSLDELPQIFNVLKGDMSFVGPRPLVIEYLEFYNEEQKRRHDVKPGLTGWAQVNGRNAISWEQKFEYDVWYVENQSFWLDIKIMWLTLIKVTKRSGISSGTEFSMKRFMGSNNK